MSHYWMCASCYLFLQDEYADKIKEVVKSHTAETTEEFRKEIERKLSEHNEDKKVMIILTTLVDISIVKLVCDHFSG